MGKLVKTTMPGKLLGAWLSWLIASSSLAYAEPAELEGGINANRSSNLDVLLHELPSASSYNHLFEHFFLPSMFALEESAGFSDVDPERLSIYGNSPLWTQWYLEDLNISDPLFSGAAAFKVPFQFLSGLELRYAESASHPFGGGPRLAVDPNPKRPRRAAGASVTIGEVGGVFPLAYPVMRAFSDSHARDREVPPPEDRRHMRERVRLHLVDEVELDDHLVRYAFEVDRGTRHYLDFPSHEVEDVSSFDETYVRVSGAAEIAPKDRAYVGYVLAEYRARSNLYAERYHGEAETVALDSGGFMLGLRSGGARLGLTYKRYAFDARDPNFSRELIDLDGEGLFPFSSSGHMDAIRVEAGYRGDVVYGQLDLQDLIWSPGDAQTHALTYAGESYGRVDLSSRETSTWIGNQRFGVADREQLGRFEWAYDGYLALMHAHAQGMDPLLFFDVGLETDITWKLAPTFQPFVILAKTPVPITSQLALTMTPGYSSATETLEDGRVTRTLGGDFIAPDSNLLGTNIYAAGLGFDSRFRSGWSLSMQGLFKAYDRTYRIGFDGSADRYGRTSEGIYYYDDGPTSFRLENTPADETPFYMSGHIQTQKVVPDEGFFVASFSVLNGIGRPPPLNGAFGNDVGIVDFSSASPNAGINALANVDSDRAFVLRLAGGLRLIDRLWGTVLVAFRDGQPFSFYEHHFSEGQLSTTMASTRGSPLQYARPLSGPREDFQLNVDAQLTYTVDIGRDTGLRLSLMAANLFDFGNEISEISTPGGELGRSALETQLPRSLYFGLEIFETP